MGTVISATTDSVFDRMGDGQSAGERGA